MFRLLGFLIGSAVSVLTILLIIGIPEFHLSNPQLDKRRFDEAVEKLREKTQDVEVMARQLTDEVLTPIDDKPVTDTSEPAMLTAEQPIPVLPEHHDVDPFAVGNVAPDIIQSPQWHSFWSPFRSELAARGFVSQLEKVTGLDYRVMKIETGVYEVAFAYLDDTQRSTYLSQISAATGLEFPGT